MKIITILFAIVLSACSSILPGSKNPRPPTPLSSKIKRKVDVSGETPTFSIIPSKSDKELWVVRSAKDPDLKFQYYKSGRQRNKNLVIIYNILKDRKKRVSGLISEALVADGFDCIVLDQEYFLSGRVIRPVVNKEIRLFTHNKNRIDFSKLGYDDYTAALMRNVGRIIRYWMPKQDLSQNFGFVGISMGGIHATMSAAIFPESKISIAVMAGGDNVELFKKSRESLVIKNRELLLKEYENYQDRDLYEDLRNLDFKILDLAQSVDTRKIRLAVTLLDTTVPTRCQLNLYNRLGRPETRFYPCGHYTLGIYYFSIKWQIQKWIASGFKK